MGKSVKHDLTANIPSPQELESWGADKVYMMLSQYLDYHPIDDFAKCPLKIAAAMLSYVLEIETRHNHERIAERQQLLAQIKAFTKRVDDFTPMIKRAKTQERILKYLVSLMKAGNGNLFMDLYDILKFAEEVKDLKDLRMIKEQFEKWMAEEVSITKFMYFCLMIFSKEFKKLKDHIIELEMKVIGYESELKQKNSTINRLQSQIKLMKQSTQDSPGVFELQRPWKDKPKPLTKNVADGLKSLFSRSKKKEDTKE